MKIQESKPENQGRVRNGCRPEIQESKPLKKKETGNESKPPTHHHNFHR